MAKEVTIEQIKSLREQTGISMMECKKALTDTNGDIEKAIDLLRKKGEKIATKRAENLANEGLIQAYIHPGAHLGVLVEIRCETDFSANTDTLKQFAHDVCLQIAAAKPLAIDINNLDPELVAKEKEIIKEQLKTMGKPANILDKIAESKLDKFYETACLMKQKFIKNDKITMQDYLNEIIAKIGENIRVQRFIKFEL